MIRFWSYIFPETYCHSQSGFVFGQSKKTNCPCVRACVRPKRFFCSAKWRPGFFYFKLFLHQIIWSIEKNFGFFDRPIFFQLFWLNFCHNTPNFFFTPTFFQLFEENFRLFREFFFEKKWGYFFFRRPFWRIFLLTWDTNWNTNWKMLLC